MTNGADAQRPPAVAPLTHDTLLQVGRGYRRDGDFAAAEAAFRRLWGAEPPNLRGGVWLSTGPGLLTRAVAAYLTGAPGRLQRLGRDIVVADQHELRAYCVSGCQASYKESRRAWQRVEFGGGDRPST